MRCRCLMLMSREREEAILSTVRGKEKGRKKEKGKDYLSTTNAAFSLRFASLCNDMQ